MLLIAALGVAFYVGIRASGPDMRLSADALYDQTNLMDIRVLGTLGMTDEDVSAIGSIEGISSVQGGYTADAICPIGSTEYVATLFSLCDDINQMTIEQGRLPESPDECFIDSWFMNNMGLQLGDTIQLISGTDQPISDTLSVDAFKIVGCGTWSWYLSWERGSSSIGNGSISLFLGLSPEAFSLPVYTVVYATVDSADQLICYSDTYEDTIKVVTEQIESIAGERCEIRYASVTEEANSELVNAQQQIDDAQKEIDDAWAKLEDARLQLEDAEKKLADGEQTLVDSHSELLDGEKELADGERELGEGRKALIEGKAELDAQIALYNESKKQLDDGQRELNEQKTQLDAKQTEVLAQKEELLIQQANLTAQLQELSKQKTDLEAQKSALIPEQAKLSAQQKELSATYNELISQRNSLAAQKDSVEQAINLFTQRDALTKQRAELAEQLKQVELSLTALKAARVIYDNQMPELREQKSKLDAEYNELDAQSKSLQNQQAALDSEMASVQSAKDALNSLNPTDWTSVSGYQSMIAGIPSCSSDLAGQTVRSVFEAVRSAVDNNLASDTELTDEFLASVVPSAASSAIHTANQELDAQTASISAKESAIALQQTALNTRIADLQSRQKTLDEILTPLESAVIVFDEKEQELTGYQTALKDGIAQIDAGLAQINTAISSIGQSYDELVAARDMLTSGIAQIEENLPALESGLSQLNSGLAQINDGLAQIDAGLAQINSYQQQADEGQKQIVDYLAQIEEGLAQMTEGRKQIQEAQAVIDDGYAQLTSGEAEIEDARRLLYNKQKELAEGEAALIQARRQLKDGKNQFTSGTQELIDGRKEVEKGREEYEKGLKEYNEAVAEAEPELEDARRQLADARKQLDEIDQPEWYVLDRNSIQTYVEYSMDAERISAIGDVFPVLFFLVAALVCLTGMTRMVEEERIQIGTFKALGYSNAMIASKYFLYAFTASLFGGVIGVLVGSSILPYVIMNAYGMLYTTLTELLYPINWPTAVSSLFIAVSCIVFAAMFACYRSLRETPANLMRPTSPPKGKRVFLEYLRPLWKRMSFGQKAAARNLFRYKKRLFMTIFGIASCTALLVVGFGLKDSIQKIVDTQYSAVWTYNSSLSADPKSLSFIHSDILQKETVILDSLVLRQSAMDAEANGRTVEANLFVPEKTEGLNDFVKFINRETRESYELNDQGVIITEKLAKLLNLKIGDSITLCRSEIERCSVPVTAISENYLYHYVYMTSGLYEDLFQEQPEFSQLFFRTEKMSAEDELAFSERLLEIEGVKSVSLVSNLQSSVANMMNAMNLVIWVLILAAAMLAFVVLFNLNNISILERRRELATLRVLGFYDGELAAYLYRENVVLTIFGIAAGVLLGIPLHSYIISTLELDMIMFGRIIQPMSYVMSVLMTVFFACIVNFGMFFTLRKIDMVESLKSVE